MPLDRLGRADEPMLQEMNTAYLRKLIRVNESRYNIGIVEVIQTHTQRFGSAARTGSDLLVMTICTRDGGTNELWVKPAKIEVWEA